MYSDTVFKMVARNLQKSNEQPSLWEETILGRNLTNYIFTVISKCYESEEITEPTNSQTKDVFQLATTNE